MALGCIPGRDIPWSDLLSFMVRSHQTTFRGFQANGPSSWYKRSELGIRAAVFFSAASISGAFGALLAVRDRIGLFSKS